MDIFFKNNKENFIQNLFSSVSSKYDLMNDLMSLSLHRKWKNIFVKYIPIIENAKYLELASGTGDISKRIIEKNNKSNNQIDEYFITEYNDDMLTILKKNINIVNTKNIQILKQDGCNLSNFENNKFDFIFVSFGIRNFYNIDIAIQEIYKKLKKDGIFVCMEFFKNTEYKSLDIIYNLYKKIIPNLSQIAIKDKHSYDYFISSINNFYTSNEFELKLIQNNFQTVYTRPVNNGICYVHIAKK